MEAKNLAFKKFGKLTAIKQDGFYTFPSGRKTAMWICECECGNITKPIKAWQLTNGHTRSCGCLKNEAQRTHGKSKTRLYKIWSGMKQRCKNTKTPFYKDYGGRGISFCEEWMAFENFEKWATQNGYTDKLTLDRIDVNGNYEPSNCRWATKKDQSNNTRINHIVIINGERKTLSELARQTGISRSTLYNRVMRGLSGEELICGKGAK